MYDDDDEKVYAERPNKTALKREAEANKALILRMMNMGDGLYKALELSEELREAVDNCKRFKKQALKRQLIFTTSLMRHEDPVAIAAQIDALERPAKQDVAAFHQLEQWRDQLLSGDNAVLDTLLNTFDAVDIQYLRQLVRNAAKEKKNNKPPKSARLLFQYLKELQGA
ncbi:MAG: ribosome biogenesis factor YjgA [Thiolinea sp.]